MKSHVKRKPSVPIVKKRIQYSNLRFLFMSLGMCAIFWYLGTLKDSPLYQVASSPKAQEVQKPSFDELYHTYVDQQNQKRCEEKGFTCKAFYIALNILQREPRTAIEYLLTAYENNISSIIDDAEAKDAYLFSYLANAYVMTGDFENAITWYQRSIKAGMHQNICFLGRVYRDIHQLEKAYELFQEGYREHFSECTLDLGTFYFNGIHVSADQQKGGKLWMEAYRDNPFSTDTNFNMAVYHANVTQDLNQYKYHLLKSALGGDIESKEYLLQPKFNERNVAYLFLDEAISQKKNTTALVQGQYFYDKTQLYQRFQAFVNQDKQWEEIFLAQGNDKNLFQKEQTSVSFGLKELAIESLVDSKASFFRDIRMLVDILYVDTPTPIHLKLMTAEEMYNQAIVQEKELDTKTAVDALTSWKILYQPDKKRIYFAIVLD